MVFEKIRANPKEWLQTIFPIIKWLPKYKVRDLSYDFIAGLTVALTLLPISLAYAQMASLKAEYGLYSSFLAQFIYIFIGSSKDAVIGPSAINSMLVGQFNDLNPLSNEGDNTYSVILSFVSGLILMAIGLLKLGFIVNLFSIPVVSGFTSASCFTIMGSQLKSFFGLKKAPNESPAMFVRHVKNVYDSWDQVKFINVYFGVASLLFLIFAEYSQKVVMICVSKYGEAKTPVGKKLRTILLEALRIFVASRNIIVFIPATGIAYHLVKTESTYAKDLALVGYVKAGFPVPRFPNFELYNLSAVAFIIQPLMLMMEMFAILKALSRKNGYRLNATNELLAVGLGNFLQSFIQAYPVTAATAKTALNDQCRARTPLSSIVSIVLIIIAIEELTGIFYYVPKAVLAAILIAAAHHLFDYETFFHIYREYKPDLFMFIVTFGLCLFYDLAYGILIAILINMVTFLRPIVKMEFCVSKEPLYHEPERKLEYVTVIQLSNGMKYPCVDKFIDRMARLMASSDHHYVIDCRFVTGIDFSGLQAWRMFLRMVYQNKKHVIFANLLESVRRQLEAIGLEHFRYVENIESAIVEHHGLSNPPGFKAPDKTSRKGSHSTGRLERRISIVSCNNLLARTHSRQDSVFAIAEEPTVSTGGASVDKDERHRHQTHQQHHSIQEHDEEEEDLEKQEARMMKILSFQPHYFHDIPPIIKPPEDMDADAGSSHHENSLTVKEEEHSAHDGNSFANRYHFMKQRGLSIVSNIGEHTVSGRVTFEIGDLDSRLNLNKSNENISLQQMRPPRIVIGDPNTTRRRKTVHHSILEEPAVRLSRSKSQDYCYNKSCSTAIATQTED